jgi:pantothenate kinase
VAPLIVAIARSVAVGQSTFARILYSIRTQVPTSRKVVLVATERLPTKTLLRRELMVQIPEQDVQPF